jgi:four helix bundle protein
MKIERFEDIKAWQEARELVRLVYKAIASNKEFAKDFRLANQIQASAVSTMANIAEGFSRKSRKEFTQFLFISKGSAAEIQSHLYVALDMSYISQENFGQIYDRADKVSRMLSNFIKYLKSTPVPQRDPRDPRDPRDERDPRDPRDEPV